MRGTTSNERPVVRAFRSAVLGWSDQESGDRLTLSVRGSKSFVEDLGRLGFESLDESERPAVVAMKGEPAPDKGCSDEPEPAPGVEHVTVRISRGEAGLGTSLGLAAPLAFRRVESARRPA